MSLRHSSRTPRPSARALGRGGGRAVPQATGRAGAGLPRYLSTTRATVTARPRGEASAAESEAQAHARPFDRPLPQGGGAAPAAVSATPRQARAAREASAHAGPGEALGPQAQAVAEQHHGLAGDAVRVHTDARAAALTQSLGANAVTAGRDLFFAPGRYAPDTAAGQSLIAHELAHVAQQGGRPQALQCDLMMSMPVTLGVFEISMATTGSGTAAGGAAGMSGDILFTPDSKAPYSAEIGLIQAVNGTDRAGQSTAAGNPIDWRNMRDVNTGALGTEAGRMELMTPGPLAPDSQGSPAGWMIDSLPSGTPRGSDTMASGDPVGPQYARFFGNPSVDFGWVRAEDDIGPAHLFDAPSISFDVDIDFETVAKGNDNQQVYGALNWGFQIRSGAVQGEYARAESTASSVFDEALERFRGYFVHEPVVLYFDNDQDQPVPGEEDKLADLADYFSRYPDVNVSVWGYADITGGERANQRLAQRRAQNAAALLLGVGVPQANIGTVSGIGETNEFSAAGSGGGAQPRTAGRLRANRRVELSFEHTVSNHPLVMP
jgi:outer membrane protein OmpA-like peptidoglycan-associated protein